MQRIDGKIKYSNKVLIFMTDYLPRVSDANIFVKGVTDKIDNVKFDMLTIKGDSKLSSFDRVGRIRVHRIGVGNPLIDRYILAFFGHLYAAKLNAARQYSVIWGVGSDYGSSAATAFKIRNKHLPFLLTLQEEDDPKNLRTKIGLIDPWFRQIFRRSDYIHCVNDSLLDWARRMGALAETKVVPNGINYDQFYRGNLRQFYIDDMKERLHINPEDKVIITSPKINKKWAHNLIKAISLLIGSDDVPVKLIVNQPGHLKRYIKRLAKKERVNKNVVFVEDVDHLEFAKYLWISDLMVIVSKLPPPNTMVLEAMAAKVGIMAVYGSNMPEFFKDKETGVFYNPDEPLYIAEKIKRMFDEKELYDEIILNGLKIARDQYSYEKLKVSIEQIIDLLINRAKEGLVVR